MTKGIIVLVGTHEILFLCTCTPQALRDKDWIPKDLVFNKWKGSFFFSRFWLLDVHIPIFCYHLEGINFNGVTKINEGFTSSSESVTNICIYLYIYIYIFFLEWDTFLKQPSDGTWTWVPQQELDPQQKSKLLVSDVSGLNSKHLGQSEIDFSFHGFVQSIVNWWFWAWWFGFRPDPLMGTPRIPNTTNPNYQLTRWWFQISFLFTPNLGVSWSNLTCAFCSIGWWKTTNYS